MGRFEGGAEGGGKRRSEHGGEGERALLIQVAGLLQGHVLERADQRKPSLEDAHILKSPRFSNFT